MTHYGATKINFNNNKDKFQRFQNLGNYFSYVGMNSLQMNNENTVVVNCF
jgi:hypothetical protein